MSDGKGKKRVDSVMVDVQGRVGKDVEVRETRGNKRIASTSIAIGQRKKNAAGHWEDGETMWFRLTAFGSDLDKVEKGDKVRALGRLTMQTWEDREGNERTSYDILVDSVEVVSKPKLKQDTEVEDEYPSEG